MKSFIKIFQLTIALSLIFAIAPQQAKAQGSVSFQVFYDDLSPYGQWVDYSGFGFVWVPTFNPLFIPYSTGGHWAYTIYGWTWVSDYHWGWAPFHYGRWDYDYYYGWFWVPGNEWGPAWVMWRTSPGYYGWVPLGPNVSINLAIGGGYYAPVDHWTFVQDQYMGRPDINTYYGPRKNNQEIINNSTVINNTYVDNSTHTTYISGPGKEDVEKVSGARFTPVTIRENSKPEQSLKNNELTIYRPTIVKSADNSVRPSKIADKKDVKPVSERAAQKEEMVKPLPPAAPEKNNKIEPVSVPENNNPESPVRPNKVPKDVPKGIQQNPKDVETQPKQQEPKPIQQIKPSQPQPPPQPKVMPKEKQQMPDKIRSQPQQPKQLQPSPQPEKQQRDQPRKQPRKQPGNQDSEE